MKIIDEDMVVQLLTFLGEIYPGCAPSLKGVLPRHEDRKAIQRHVAYCFEMGWIEAYTGKKDADNAFLYHDANSGPFRSLIPIYSGH